VSIAPDDEYGRLLTRYSSNDPELASERRALLYYQDGKILLNFSAALIKRHYRSVQVRKIPLLRKDQADALEAVFEVASKHRLKMNLQPGDLQFINNLAILHSREKFEDDPTSKRHLIRLWLANEDTRWVLPPALELIRQEIFYNEELEENWEILPISMEWPPLPRCLSH
jgi:Taurine catabolism dioxygenase TauD, TfdA family